MLKDYGVKLHETAHTETIVNGGARFSIFQIISFFSKGD